MIKSYKDFKFVLQDVPYDYKYPGHFQEVKSWGEYKEIVKEHINGALTLSDLNGYISSNLSGVSFNKKDVYSILFLDVDSQPSLEKCTKYLTKKKINYTLFESSKKKYWIIADIILPINRITKIIKRIPGVDKRYVYIGEERVEYVFRGFPKGELPRLLNRVNIFGSSSERYLNFVNAFEEYWNSEFIHEIYKDIFAVFLGDVNARIY